MHIEYRSMGRVRQLMLAIAGLGLAISAAWAQGELKAFDLPKQDAAAGVAAFARQADVQLLISAVDAQDRKTNEVRGSFPIGEALNRLLEGTGLRAELTGTATYTVVPESNQAAAVRGVQFARAEGTSKQSASNSDADGSRIPGTESASPAQLQELIVTATKRSERIQDVPMSITALGGLDIERRGLVDRSDYLRSIPGVSLQDNGPGLNNIMIRGAYGRAFDTGPTVGVYFGDVPLAGYAIGGSSDIILADIERIEVLRGPQGTLFGSNSLSGTVRYIPHAPDLHDFAGDVQAGYSRTARHGGDNTLFEGVLNAPIIQDKLAVRAVAFRHENDGFYRNVAGSDPVLQAAARAFGAEDLALNEDQMAGTRYTGGRFSALWKPNEILGITLTYLKQETAQEDRPFELAQYGQYQQADYQHGGPGRNKDALQIDLDILNLVGEVDLGWGALTSSTAMIDQKFTRIWDVSYLAFFSTALFGNRAPVTQLSITKAEALTQELRFTSAFGGPFEMIGGLYYEDSEQPTSNPSYYVGAPAQNPYGTALLWETAYDRKLKQKAVFGELSYKFSNKLKATLGGRAFEYDTEFPSGILRSSVPFIPPSQTVTMSNESSNTFKAGLELNPTDNSLIYTTWSQGFRLGRPGASFSPGVRHPCDLDGDNVLDGTSITTESLGSIRSDTLESVELGGKLSTINGRLVLNAAAYHNDWTDIPVTVRPPGCAATAVVNGGSARARGFDIDGALRLTDSIQLGFGVGYVDSELTADSLAGGKGDRMNFTPKLNGNASIEYAFALAGREAYVRGDYGYFGDHYTATGERGRKADAYSIVNLSAGMVWSQFDVRLLVTNVLNDDSVTSLEGIPSDLVLRLRPRTMGLTVGYHF